MDVRDHLFISYSTEDFQLAEFLTLRLTALGYSVWCDRVKLLGGESYPRDIDRAIKDRSFRVLALLSRNSIDKPNPRKERTLALNLGRERGEDFLIPLNIDRLAATDLDWMVSDLTFIPFHDWGAGLRQLLARLEDLETPKPRSDGATSVRDYFRRPETLRETPERLWTNLLPIERIPAVLRNYRLQSDALRDEAWPCVRSSSDSAWSFYPPQQVHARAIDEIDWAAQPFANGMRTFDVVSSLLRQHIQLHYVSKGLRRIGHDEFCFPRGLLPQDKINYVNHDGKKTWIAVVGTKTFFGAGIRETNHHHLVPVLRPRLRGYPVPVLELKLRLHLTDTAGASLDPSRVVRRSKRIRNTWWNREWRSRVLATASWLADGQSEFRLGDQHDPILVGALPLTLTASTGIDESRLSDDPVDDRNEIADLEDEDDG